VTLRDLPSIEGLLQSEDGTRLRTEFGHTLAVEALRLEVDRARAAVRQHGPVPSPAALVSAARRRLHVQLASSLQPVINATGVILHTNLGRAVLSQDAQAAMLAAASGYTTLEYDLDRGGRGRREAHAEPLLQQITGAEAALVVNNNAAAVLLTLTALARRREVVISRSQLIEIGGGFRIPEVLAQSGAKLVEVGTTNRIDRTSGRSGRKRRCCYGPIPPISGWSDSPPPPRWRRWWRSDETPGSLWSTISDRERCSTHRRMASAMSRRCKNPSRRARRW
jgi:L-seryl-tRNA(Ser) seleniumtransferase